jgi:CheY-like chemotaxis protein
VVVTVAFIDVDQDDMPDSWELEHGLDPTRDDSGEGMERATIEKCFDPFFTTKEVGQGTGLGLSTTYGIIKSHEGLISVDSRPQEGTTFKIYFPLADLEDQLPQENPPQLVHGNGQRILVVDDEPDILNALRDLLKLLNYQPSLAANGKEALEQYQAVKPHAVLMDINMPEMDGLVCIEKMLKLDPDANISVITGYEMEGLNGLSQQGKNAIKYYVAKPIALAELSVILSRMMAKKGQRIKDKE